MAMEVCKMGPSGSQGVEGMGEGACGRSVGARAPPPPRPIFSNVK